MLLLDQFKMQTGFIDAVVVDIIRDVVSDLLRFPHSRCPSRCPGQPGGSFPRRCSRRRKPPSATRQSPVRRQLQHSAGLVGIGRGDLVGEVHDHQMGIVKQRPNRVDVLGILWYKKMMLTNG